MKLPLEFALKFVFRLVFPGALFAAAMFPLLRWITLQAAVPIRFEYLYPVAVIGLGWLITVCDMHIYMLFEGRRYWPMRFHDWMLERETERLKAIEAEIFANAPLPKPAEEDPRRTRRYLEASVRLRTFPRDKDGVFFAQHPTRLGNIIAAYEHYPSANYGIDAVFYWYRLWVMLDKDLREELDNAQALVDSTVYVTFVLCVSGLLMFGYAALGNLAYWCPGIATAVRLPHVSGSVMPILLGIACLGAARMLYCLSLHAHAQYGETFKSVFDQYRTKLNFDDIVRTVGKLTGAPMLPYTASSRDKYRIAWFYLQWGRAWDDVENRSKTVAEWQLPPKP
jgi:hypothetical protein